MVTSATTFSRSGLSDWVVQRFSAIVLAVYTVVVLGWLICTGSDVNYANWSAFMGCIAMRIGSTLVLLSLVAHAWVGLWSVLTDYVTTRQIGSVATALRLIAQFGIAVVLFAILVWGLVVVWGGL